MLPADVYARFQRARGRETLYICATDEHGTPTELAAAEAGVDPATFCAQQHEVQHRLGRAFGLSWDDPAQLRTDDGTQNCVPANRSPCFESNVSRAFQAVAADALPGCYAGEMNWTRLKRGAAFRGENQHRKSLDKAGNL